MLAALVCAVRDTLPVFARMTPARVRKFESKISKPGNSEQAAVFGWSRHGGQRQVVMCALEASEFVCAFALVAELEFEFDRRESRRQFLSSKVSGLLDLAHFDPLPGEGQRFSCWSWDVLGYRIEASDGQRGDLISGLQRRSPGDRLVRRCFCVIACKTGWAVRSRHSMVVFGKHFTFCLLWPLNC